MVQVYQNGVNISRSATAESMMPFSHKYTDDLRFSLAGKNLDTTRDKLDRDWANGGIRYQKLSAAPKYKDALHFIAQSSHEDYLETWKPHVHYYQRDIAKQVNWVLGYRLLKNGSDVDELAFKVAGDSIVLANYTWLKVKKTVFTDTSIPAGKFRVQIDAFDWIDLKGLGVTPENVSTMFQFLLVRDSLDSTGVSGTETESSNITAIEFDVHWEKSTLGSYTEFSKYK